MAVTRTASLAMVGPKAVHAGVNAVSGSYTGAGLSASGSGLLLLARIPATCQVIGLLCRISSPATTQTMNFGVRSQDGTSISASLIGAAVAGSNLIASRVVPVNLSANTSEKYKYVTASIDTGTVTASMQINYTILYQMDSQPV